MRSRIVLASSGQRNRSAAHSATANVAAVSLPPAAAPANAPASTSARVLTVVPALRAVSRTMIHSAAIRSAASCDSFIVVPSVATPMAPVMPIANAHPTAILRSRGSRSAKRYGSSLARKNAATPAGTASTNAMIRGGQSHCTIAKNGMSSSGL
jgi:hypothetical protein